MPPRKTSHPLLTWEDVAGAAGELPVDAEDLLKEILARYETRTGVPEMVSESGWFIKELTVCGHVGIGEKPLHFSVPPVPGVVFVSARNGVGKTSCADAIRFVVSNGNARSYRIVDQNVHFQTRDIRIAITDGNRDATLGYSKQDGIFWESDGRQRASLSSDWEKEYARYRPVLLYPEISSVIEQPSLLHGFLGDGLALDVLYQLLSDVDAVSTKSKLAERNAKAAFESVQAELAKLPLGHPLISLVTNAGPTPDSDTVANFQQVVRADLDIPETRFGNLSPVWSVDSNGSQQLRAAVRQLELSRAEVIPGATEAYKALAQFAGEPVSDYLAPLRASDECPVCGTREVGWFAAVQRSVGVLGGKLSQLHDLEREVDSQWVALRSTSFPSRMSDQTRQLLTERGHLQIIAEWDHLLIRVDSLRTQSLTTDVVNELCSRSAVLVGSYEAIRAAAGSEEGAKRSDSVRLQTLIDTWVGVLAEGREALRTLAASGRLARWVDRKIKETRASLFGPIADKVRELWAELSIDSDLTVSDLRLTGGTRAAKKVEIDILLSGTPVEPGPDAPAVLSTGQRNALTLATYFPRAAQAQSPFRFLVLDDPVQAFDPWRVRYLARLIASYAKTFQIIVLSHDDRLWAELSQIGAVRHHIRLDRPPNELSTVTATGTSPGVQYLVDLEKVVASEHQFPVGTDRAASSMVLTMCRLALDTELGMRIEVLGRRAGLDSEDIARERDLAADTRSQIDLLNRYAAVAGCGRVDRAPHEPLLTALNGGSHGLAPKAAKSLRRYWINSTRALIDAVQESEKAAE